MKKAIIYLHGFNSASVDMSGYLLTSKEKLVVLKQFCLEEGIKFYTPNVDYRDYQQLIENLMQQYKELQTTGYAVCFIGSSLGGFTCEYMAMKTATKAIMINPTIQPSILLQQFIGVTENFETQQPYEWTAAHCEQFIAYENELNQQQAHLKNLTILLDMADELIDATKTVKKYKNVAEVVCYEGGSHGFEHSKQAMPVVKKVLEI